MKPTSRLEYMFEPEQPAPTLPLVSVFPDLGRGYGWIVRVGACEMEWCWFKRNADRIADQYREGRL